jgi:hypothetical protein
MYSYVCSDNLSVVAWCNLQQVVEGKRFEDSPEKRQLGRLIEGIQEELMLLKQLCEVTVKHIPGKDNPADRLSRILYRVYPEQKKEKKDKLAAMAVRSVTESTIAEKMCGHVRCWYETLNQFRAILVFMGNEISFRFINPGNSNA